jgi:hypothetical protein
MAMLFAAVGAGAALLIAAAGDRARAGVGRAVLDDLVGVTSLSRGSRRVVAVEICATPDLTRRLAE